MNDSVYALAWDGACVYAGGFFTTAGGVTVNRIAKWNGTSWSALSTGMNSAVDALAWDGTSLYAGGFFKTAGGVSVNYIGKWDGSAWSALGIGMNGPVYALVWGGTNLYAGGTFTNAGGVPASRIAKWDGAAWSAMGPGTDGTVRTLAWDGSNLWAGGDFWTAGGVTAKGVAKWNGSAWSGLGSSISKSVRALAWDGTGLYAGGEFTMAGANVSAYIARWTPPAAISANPQNQVLCGGGGNISFSVAASGTGLAFNWQEDAGSGFADLADGGVYSGAATPTLSLTGVTTAMNGFKYRCNVTGACGPTATSNSAMLTVSANPSPTISGPASNTCPAQAVGLSTEAGMSAYQWFLDGSPIDSATSSSYAANASGSYTVRSTDGHGCAGLSLPYAVAISFCDTTEVSPQTSLVPARLVKDAGSKTGYYLYFERIPSSSGYNLYEGDVPKYYCHGSTPGNVCHLFVKDAGAGEMQAVISPSAGDHYYLVTAFADRREGPSGFDSAGSEIPKSQSTCRP
jgi:hypothetical protein